ncbi:MULTISPECIES: hypothetical protein [Cyanophyceae]|nr:hypothetical protein [Phormidium sp. FACHB-592]
MAAKLGAEQSVAENVLMSFAKASGQLQPKARSLLRFRGITVLKS